MFHISEHYDVVVLGGGPVGSYCAFLSGNKGLKTLLIEVNDKLGGQPLNLYAHKKITDFPLHLSITANELVKKINEQLHSVDNVDIITSTKVDDFDTKNIVIATGNGISKPNLLEIPGASCDKVKYFVKPYDHYDNKHVIILGGGDSAVDWANNISKHSQAKVTIIHRRDTFRATGENVNELSKNKVNVLLNKQCVKIKDNILFIKDNVSEKEEKLSFDEIIVQYGQKMDINPEKYIQKLNCSTGNKIIVDHNQKANSNRIYAIGDAC